MSMIISALTSINCALLTHHPNACEHQVIPVQATIYVGDVANQPEAQSQLFNEELEHLLEKGPQPNANDYGNGSPFRNPRPRRKRAAPGWHFDPFTESAGSGQVKRAVGEGNQPGVEVQDMPVRIVLTPVNHLGPLPEYEKKSQEEKDESSTAATAVTETGSPKQKRVPLINPNESQSASDFLNQLVHEMAKVSAGEARGLEHPLLVRSQERSGVRMPRGPTFGNSLSSSLWQRTPFKKRSKKMVEKRWGPYGMTFDHILNNINDDDNAAVMGSIMDPPSKQAFQLIPPKGNGNPEFADLFAKELEKGAAKAGFANMPDFLVGGAPAKRSWTSMPSPFDYYFEPLYPNEGTHSDEMKTGKIYEDGVNF